MPTSYLHGSPHPISSLPNHPSLKPDPNSDPSQLESGPPPLREFLHTILTEAQTLLSSIPQTFHGHRKPRSSPPASAPIQLLTRSDTVTRDFWVCRKSIHEDAAVDGSASWGEFRSGLRQNHAENEMAYTPSVTAVKRLLEWPTESEIEGGWKQVEMHVNMITHTFHPSLLIAARTFIVLAVSADLPALSPDGFVTVQVPLDCQPKTSIPSALRQEITELAPRNSIFASYVSVEEVVSQPDGIEWTMATASDAGGAIPQWVQRSWTMGGIPKAIVSDVGLFLKWTAERRGTQPQNLIAG